MAHECCSTQLIDGNGTFDNDAIARFMETGRFAGCGTSYAVVAIVGPQCSGKSTLLNHLFHTDFKEMNSLEGRYQTTKGIWLAQCVDSAPFTIVMDLEGSDGRKRGEDDSAFEKQSALFALAVSDIVLINMWCHDIGREHAGNRPLLKTVFQVLSRLNERRKTTLFFVIRDRTRTPLELLEASLKDDVKMIWDSVPKPLVRKETPVSDFFNVEVVALSNYEDKLEDFKEEVAELRKRVCNCIGPGGLAGDRHGVVPASGFSVSARQIWKDIMENKDLDIPSHKVLVATVRCEEIAKKTLASFTDNVRWCQLKAKVQTGRVPGLGEKLSSLVDNYLSQYDEEAAYFDHGVKTANRQKVESKLLQMVQHAYVSMLGHQRKEKMEEFKSAFSRDLEGGKGFAIAARECTQSCLASFEEGCTDAAIQRAKWDASKVRDELRRDIDAHVASVLAAKLSELTSFYEGQLNRALAKPVEELLDAASDDTWPAVRRLLQRETESARSGLSSVLAPFEIKQATVQEMLSKLEDYARSAVESKAKEESRRVLLRMKDRFATVFSRDSDSVPRAWTVEDDIGAITKTALSATLKLLAVMAAIRLDEDNDGIERTLSSALMESGNTAGASLSIQALTLRSWEGVHVEKTLLTPVDCENKWSRFKAETEYIVMQAKMAQEANKRRTTNLTNLLPPPWAIATVALLYAGYIITKKR